MLLWRWSQKRSKHVHNWWHVIKCILYRYSHWFYYVSSCIFYCGVHVSCNAKLCSSSRRLQGQGAFLHMWICTSIINKWSFMQFELVLVVQKSCWTIPEGCYHVSSGLYHEPNESMSFLTLYLTLILLLFSHIHLHLSSSLHVFCVKFFNSFLILFPFLLYALPILFSV